MKVRFGDFALDLDARELRRDGKPVPLSTKGFRLLEVLVESRPKALSKTALHELIWPDTVVVETNLSNLIGEIRAALGEDARQPRFIRTVHRFGYAFQVEAATIAGGGGWTRVRLKWPGGTADLGKAST